MRHATLAISASMLLLAAVLLAGCGGRRSVYDSLYAEMSEDISVCDPSVLSGRRIVIDPGHGGEYDGALGADSLSEAEVNLGVALYLWGLLREAGAEVYMTRSSDRDFLPDSVEVSKTGLADALRDDLAGRAGKANMFEPEVFISIHHNSNIALDRARNGVEVYYRGSDPGASLELATDIHTHLARNLGISTTTIKPGNYYVLRNSEAGAAVLGEASYISHPGVEEKLRLSAKQKLEAEAYYLGLIEYFSRGVPVISMREPGNDTLTAPARIEFSVTPGAGIPIDPASIEARIDGVRIACFQPEGGGDAFFLMPASMPNGTFDVTFSATSEKGATATFGPKEMTLDRPARFFLPMPPIFLTNGSMRLKVLVLDSGGRPVADGKAVTLSDPDGKNGSVSQTKNGKARFIRESTAGTFRVSSGPLADTLTFDSDGPETSVLTIAVDSLTGNAIPRAVLRFADGSTAEADERGCIRSSSGGGDVGVIYAAGYLPAPLEKAGKKISGDRSAVPITRMAPLFGGILHGKRIVIDPAGGGTDDAGRGPGAMRGATVNLRLASALERMLTAAGASVLVTRSGEEQLSDQQRIFSANRFGADLAIGLRFGGAAGPDQMCVVLHYPGSSAGKAAADSLAASLAGTPPCGSSGAEGSSDLFLQQTSCPAVVISGGSLSDPDTETILGSSRWVRLESRAILRGLLGNFGAKD
jgi:N-acetylmuramoyl-L-alanine amidase